MRQYQFLVQANLFILLFLADLRIVTGEKDTSLSTTVSKAKSKLKWKSKPDDYDLKTEKQI